MNGASSETRYWILILSPIQKAFAVNTDRM
jgi:hypothetical protein